MPDALLEVADVSLSFGGVRALEQVSLRAPTGSIVGLIGPNGAGKTTLFNVISGLQRPDGGVIRFAGTDVSTKTANQRAALGIGRSFQNLGLIRNETAAVNIMAAQHLAVRYRSWDVVTRPWRWWSEEARVRKRAAEVARVFGIARYWDDRVDDLSFGAARFVELACVLVESPRLMLLDEPTTGLDARETDQLLGVLREQRELGTTVLLVAHDVRFVMGICDHIYVLAEGRLLFDGPPQAVQRDTRVIRAYLGRTA